VFILTLGDTAILFDLIDLENMQWIYICTMIISFFFLIAVSYIIYQLKKINHQLKWQISEEDTALSSWD